MGGDLLGRLKKNLFVQIIIIAVPIISATYGATWFVQIYPMENNFKTLNTQMENNFKALNTQMENRIAIIKDKLEICATLENKDCPGLKMDLIIERQEKESLIKNIEKASEELVRIQKLNDNYTKTISEYEKTNKSLEMKKSSLLSQIEKCKVDSGKTVKSISNLTTKVEKQSEELNQVKRALRACLEGKELSIKKEEPKTKDQKKSGGGSLQHYPLPEDKL